MASDEHSYKDATQRMLSEELTANRTQIKRPNQHGTWTYRIRRSGTWKPAGLCWRHSERYCWRSTTGCQAPRQSLKPARYT